MTPASAGLLRLMSSPLLCPSSSFLPVQFISALSALMDEHLFVLVPSTLPAFLSARDVLCLPLLGAPLPHQLHLKKLQCLQHHQCIWHWWCTWHPGVLEVIGTDNTLGTTGAHSTNDVLGVIGTDGTVSIAGFLEDSTISLTIVLAPITLSAFQPLRFLFLLDFWVSAIPTNPNTGCCSLFSNNLHFFFGL